MFNALNRFISRLDSDTASQNFTDGVYGFQVLRSTTSNLAIEPWFDFIVEINGRLIVNLTLYFLDHPNLFVQEVQNCAGNTVALGLWSAKVIRPTQSSLGLTLQWTSINIVSHIWHILDVPENSPADLAGLLPYGDYIIGARDRNFLAEISLGELVEEHIGQPLCLYVYNNEFDVTREVTIYPSREWGGEGALGCVLGYGALHRLPAPLNEPTVEPGETLFETEHVGFSDSTYPTTGTAQPYEPSELLIPAQIAAFSSAPTPAKKREKRQGNIQNSAFIDDYFTEGEKKSREIDHAPASLKNLPPPPQSGGPPKEILEGGPIIETTPEKLEAKIDA
ncbi:golgi reassembly-stacking protein 2 [Blumeria hordei DH14]|uniref:Golgi reassembly-stacking protein 2 n=1 Tax=Blumeria graminis f. sp. hordei (strain DH14) TaxID=546991 RepID=N1JE26_BLUG1|nr:golgi reassembly-stacking protein 2 [Blumeria hordei DH14]